MSVDIINDLAKTGTRLSRIAQTLFELPELPGVAFGPRDLDAQMDGLLRNLIAEIQALEAAPPTETPVPSLNSMLLLTKRTEPSPSAK